MTSDKWTTAKIPDQKGRVAVVTGANTGLGLETARALAERGAAVVLAVRNLDKGRAAADAISEGGSGPSVTVQELDLASLASVRKAAREVRSAHDRVDLLINNAGVMYTPESRTEDGFELQFGTNHLGHFALTGLLVDYMLSVEGSRVVTVSSTGHRIRSEIDFDDLGFERNYSRMAAYGRSKLANLLFTYELQRRFTAAGVPTLALASHPGGASTELARNSPVFVRAFEVVTRPVVQSAAMGALPTLRAATDPAAVGGQYYGPGGLFEFRGHPEVVKSSTQSHDVEIQRRLWTVSEELTGVTYPI